jgi:hypothetical protein
MIMELTTEQKEQIRQAKAAGERHMTLCFTPEQRRGWQTAVQEELAGKEENIAHYRKRKAAADHPGFFGSVPVTQNCRRTPWTGYSKR